MNLTPSRHHSPATRGTLARRGHLISAPAPKIALSLGLGLALGFALPAESLGQNTGAPISSGSGAGTGTGQESSTGLGTTGTGRETGLNRPPLSGGLDTAIPPLSPDSTPVGPGDPVQVSKQMLDQARAITDPGERAFALERLARTAVFSGQPEDAAAALLDAMAATRQVPSPLVRDQRISAIITTALSLAEETIRAGTADDPNNDPTSATPAVAPKDQPKRLERARLIWDRTLEVAREIQSATTRTETIYRIVESQSFSSQNLIVDPVSRKYGTRPDPSKLNPELRKYSDALLVEAATHALEIDRPLFRDRALISVVTNAAISAQFGRAIEIARMIPQAEARVDALIRIAENQAILDKATDATATYSEAARTVAMIPQVDPREILNNVLIDSLISVGRFDDARACVGTYDNPQRKVLALGAVAESQGRRGLSASARAWIAQEPSPELRAVLSRKLAEGLSAAIEQNRSKEQIRQGIQ